MEQLLKDVSRCEHCEQNLQSLGRVVSRVHPKFHIYLQSDLADIPAAQAGHSAVTGCISAKFRYLIHAQKSASRPIAVIIRTDSSRETDQKLERAADIIADKLLQGEEPQSSFEL